MKHNVGPVNPDAIEASARETSAGPERRTRWGLPLAVFLFAFTGAVAVLLGNRLATSAVLDIGPTDSNYARGFRDVERDGPLYFRWSSVPSSALSLPVRFCGPGSVRMRVRRHFVDPAVLSVAVAGTVVGQVPVQAGTDRPYEIIEFPVAKAICDSNASVLLESVVDSGKLLGVAVDWVELRSPAGFRAPPRVALLGGAVLAMIAVAIWLAGGRLSSSLAINAALAMLIGFGFAANPVAAERILRGGSAAMFLTLGLGFLIGRLFGAISLSRRGQVILVAITVATLVSRSTFLHTQAFYPDYRVHALVQQTLDGLGLSRFLDQLLEIQYARSLGLQQIDGRWYPFPYPPGSYVLAGIVGRIFGLDALDASVVTAVTAASLIPLLTVAIGVSLGLGEFVALAGALYVALQPLLVRRMALGYFPGLAGELVDAVAVLLMIRLLRAPNHPIRRFGLLALALLTAFLVYTQSIANFGLLVAGLLCVELVRRSPGGGRAASRVAVAAALALSASAGVFYWRYVPVMRQVANHQPMAESVVLDRLDQLRRNAPAHRDTAEAVDLNDPYAGSTVNPARGLARLGSRIWRFNGPFAFAIVLGGWLLWRQSDRVAQNLILAWSAVSLWISLLAAGLPSPNGFRHLKDLEFIWPLAALGLGVLTRHLWDRRPALGAVLAGTWMIFAMRAFWVELRDRLMPLVGL